MAFLSVWTACCTRPLEALAASDDVTVLDPMKIFWNASCVPEAAVRPTTSIDPVAVAPGTWLQSRMSPEKIAWIVLWDTLASLLSGLVTRQIASRAILLKKMPPGSLDFGSRDELPMVTRPAATSATPTSEPPWASLNFTLPLWVFRYSLASSVASGATEVEPLIVMTGVAEAVPGTTAARTPTAAAHTPRRRRRVVMFGDSFVRWKAIGRLTGARTGLVNRWCLFRE